MKIKRVIAVLCVGFGVFFTGMLILRFWGVVDFTGNSILMDAVVPTTGALSAGFLALLVVLKLVEDKK